MHFPYNNSSLPLKRQANSLSEYIYSTTVVIHINTSKSCELSVSEHFILYNPHWTHYRCEQAL